MNKEIIEGNSATEIVKQTVIKTCDIVASTLGPKGKNVIIDSECNGPFITNDGVTIAKNLEFDSSLEVVSKIIKEASIKTCEEVGDGTTTSLVLLKSIYLESLEYLKKGYNPFELKEILTSTSNKICEEIKKKSNKCNYDDIYKIALNSCGNENASKCIKESFEATGETGLIMIEETKFNKLSLEIINGMYIDSGSVSSYFIKNRNKEEILDNPLILITDNKVNSINELKEVLNVCKTSNRSLVIFAESFDEDAIKELSYYKLNDIINIVCVNAPNYSENKVDILEDICIYTNAKLISDVYGNTLDNVDLSYFGTCKKAKITNNYIIIFEDKKKSTLTERIKKIESQIFEEESEYKKEILENRLANISKGIGIIKVGAKTNAERTLLKMRIEDAVCASKSALKYGYSLGGGLTYYNISKTLIGNDIGNKILKQALLKPMEQILLNGNIDYSKIVNYLNTQKESIGYDVNINKYVDMHVYGIIDPTEVLITALKNAISISTILLTINTIIVTKNKKISPIISEEL